MPSPSHAAVGLPPSPRLRRTSCLAVIVVAIGAALSAQTQAPTARITLTDVTRDAGITARHDNGAAGGKLLPETMGAGAAFFDFDNDGDQDLLSVNGLFPGGGGGRFASLYRNDGTGRFTDVSARVGLQPNAERRTPNAEGSLTKPEGRKPMADGRVTKADSAASAALRYGMGVAAADMDNDGWTDVILTSVGGLTLFRNDRGARFVDVTAAAGLADRRGFSTCAVWVDVDRDGLVDLLVCNYVQWSPQTDLYCSAGGTQKTYCTPQAYRGSTSWLFR